jgi:hypothetical protein
VDVSLLCRISKFKLRISVNTGLSGGPYTVKLVSTKLNVRASVAQLVEELRHKTGGSGFNFKVADSFCPHSVALGSTQPRTEKEYREISLGVQCGRRVELTALRPCAEYHSKRGSPNFHPLYEGL